jgi:catechol 2,3-dioxygenase
VRLQVRDLSRSLAYYEEVLGLRLVAREADEAALAPAGTDQPLVTLKENRAARAVPRGGLIGLYHFAILLPDRGALGRFAAHAGAAGVPMGAADHAVSEALYLSDPDGLGIEVYADRPREAWRSDVSRELFMTTAPLDVRALMADAGGAAWSGMPTGTRMGHVHLHVGSLDEAAAFYHAALGFTKTVWSYPGALFLAAGGYHHHLGLNTWSSGRPAGEGDARLLWWELVVPTRDQAAAAAGQLSGAGYRVTTARGSWTAADPWGTGLRITTQE